mmetsp:Transcript_11238/g.18374  ORF Transcript_11238/g.18374 Transcript_11238/m.18374 type:complete len:224 (+) Transcript_11238:139-810(+)
MCSFTNFVTISRSLSSSASFEILPSSIAFSTTATFFAKVRTFFEGSLTSDGIWDNLSAAFCFLSSSSCNLFFASRAFCRALSSFFLFLSFFSKACFLSYSANSSAYPPTFESVCAMNIPDNRSVPELRMSTFVISPLPSLPGASFSSIWSSFISGKHLAFCSYISFCTARPRISFWSSTAASYIPESSSAAISGVLGLTFGWIFLYIFSILWPDTPLSFPLTI